jgi:uncharacterized protein YndB with AHSA1/START domain
MITIAAVVVFLVAAVLTYAGTRPNTFRIARSARIEASPERVFALINDFHGWGSWSPWEKLDPAMKRTYSGAASGKGAVYEWEGDKNVGQGRMEIAEAVPGTKVVIKLDFIKPFEGHNVAEFTLEAQGGATNVSWAMSGPLPFFMKCMHLVVNMDRMVGKNFEDGLSSMNAVAGK